MIELYYGAPGTGKTTLLAMKAYKATHRRRLKKRYKKVYCNAPIVGTYSLDVSTLGDYDLGNSLVLIDEASIEFNNRDWKMFPKKTRDYLKLHRHYGTDFIYVSQHYADTEVTIRRLANDQYNLKKVLGLTFFRHIKQRIDIDDNTHQLADFDYKVSWLFGGLHFFRRRKYYKYFDSWDAPELPVYESSPWYEESEGPKN